MTVRGKLLRCSAVVSAAVLAGFLAGGGGLREWIVYAQSSASTPITLSVTNGTGSGNAKGLDLSGAGTLGGFGPPGSTQFTITGSLTSLLFTIAIDNADALTATGSATAGVETISGSATVTGGAGMFNGYTGSFTFSINAPFGTTSTAVSFSLSGSGSVTPPPVIAGAGLMFSQDQITFSTTQEQIKSALLDMTAGTTTLIMQNLVPASSMSVSNAKAGSSIPTTIPASSQSFVSSAKAGSYILTTSPASGTVPAGASVPLTVTATPPTTIDPGIYPGSVTITSLPSPAPVGTVLHSSSLGSSRDASSSAVTQTIPVTLIISSGNGNLALSQSGLWFTTAPGAAAPPAKSLVLSSTGPTPSAFTATSSTLSGGSWLTVSPTTGTVSAATPATVSVSVSASTLAPGDYFGTINFATPAAGNSPQSVEIVLRVLGPGAYAEEVGPSGLIFGSGPGAITSKPVQITDLGVKNLTFSTTTAYQIGSGWFSVTPATGTAIAGEPLNLTVSVNAAGLLPGDYEGTLNVFLVEENITRPVAVALYIPPSGTPASAVPAFAPMAQTAGCTPSHLLAVFTQLGDKFQVPAGFPAPLQALVEDNCGNPLTSGTVAASFSSGDPSVSMISLGNGQWSGTWLPHTAAGGAVTVTLYANSTSPALAGTVQISGQLTANSTDPIVNAGGETSAASFAGNTPLAPGGFISIFGSNLATGLTQSGSFPFATQLAGTQVILGGELLPLQYVDTRQINAIVPYDVPVNAQLQLLVQQNGMSSLPETVFVAAAQPAVFTQDQSGAGAGIIVAVKPDGSQFEVTAAHPASAGDALVMYCAGLGAVSPPVIAGTATPLATSSQTVNTVTATIGGVPAHVFFAGLTAGFAGLYQVNVFVPTGIGAAPNVPVVLSVAGASSPPVTVAIQ